MNSISTKFLLRCIPDSNKLKNFPFFKSKAMKTFGPFSKQSSHVRKEVAAQAG